MKPLLPHGTHAAFNRHKKRGETPCATCIAGERAYQQHRHLRRSGAFTQVDGQRPLMATVRPQPAPQLPARGLPVTPKFLDSEHVAQIAVALLQGVPTMAVSYTRNDGLRLHVDASIADDWITAAPMADDDATIYHLPVSWTA